MEDYLDVRPERGAELSAALRDGRIEAGPWFVLADELIPSGEGLVRNLLAGTRTLRRLRAQSPPVLYCPDSFGHPAALPALAAGFGKPVIILWRGFRGAKTAISRWTAPNGDRALLYHLTRSGYELGANLPVTHEGARARWERIRDEFEQRQSNVELLLNGADHHARQARLDEALSRLRDVAGAIEIRAGGMSTFVDAAVADSGDDLPVVRGELRDSYGYTWTLQGTLASRTSQKRRFALIERALVRDVEPWAGLAAMEGSSLRHLTNAAWRPLLLCQPHDTLCGCSIDVVARAMDARLEAAETQADGLREQAIFALLHHDPDAARTHRDAWSPTLLVRNRVPRVRSGVAIVTLSTWVADAPAGPGSALRAIHDIALPPVPKLVGAPPPQVLDRTVAHERVESPRAYPDNDEVLRVRAAVWVDSAPAYGILPVALTRARTASRLRARPVEVDRNRLTNGNIGVSFSADGGVRFEQNGRLIEGLVGWESRTDVGDLYTPAIREECLTARLLGTRPLHRGPLRGTVEQRWRLLGAASRVDVRVRYTLDAETSWLRIYIEGDNAARNHRLRLRLRTDVNDPIVFADAAFGSVLREPVNVPLETALIELPVQTAPLHRYVSLFNKSHGATIFSDGLTEYEAQGADVLVTLLRSVGELSRMDLPERPGNAGWPAPTPDAQHIGPFAAELALMLHGRRSVEVLDEIERAADDVLCPLTGETLRSALAVPQPLSGIALDGRALSFSAAKESDDGEWLVLRCVNLSDIEMAGTWTVATTIREAQLARLDETPIGPVSVLDDQVRFVAPPRGIVTVLVR